MAYESDFSLGGERDSGDVYAGTGGTNNGVAQKPIPYAGPGASGAWTQSETRAWWGWGEEYLDKALDSYSKSSVSDSVDKGLASAKTTTDKLATAANNWLGYASDPAKLESALTMVTVIVCVLGGVYVLAMIAPVLRGVSAK